jgi:4-amino-4-deoxy-L-arabinose transferase-like glycosyltransferase
VSHSEAAERAPKMTARLNDMRVAAAILALVSVFILFHDLGGAALFDPDEGRNAEIGREILETGDWVIPYYNFLPRLEKPMLFYAATAISYKLFGVSEASARLPSALAAAGVLLLTYCFVRRIHGERAALWSGLILLTCIQFNAFSRIVILDMTLSFFITATLIAYYRAGSAEDRAQKRRYYLLMYAAAAGATLVKGPIGFVLPGIVIAAYIAARRKWSSVAEMELGRGVFIFILIVAPWYVAAELRHPGYLAYFLGQEHFARYLTAQFHRTKPWYYFFLVVTVGFLPWTFLVPSIGSRLKKNFDGPSLYAVLWAVVPFAFFSFSSSKMSEYLLPIYPALAILAGKTLADALDDRGLRLLAVGWLILSLSLLYLALGFTLPRLLPVEIRETFGERSNIEIASLALLASASLLCGAWSAFAAPRRTLFLLSCLAFILTFFFAHRFIEPISLTRSYKEFAVRSAALLRAQPSSVPLVLYESYFPSLPFYLRIRAPIWTVADEDDSEIMGSFYLSDKRPATASGYGRALLTADEFEREWTTRKLFVFVKEKRLLDLHGAKVLLQVANVVLVTNR